MENNINLSPVTPRVSKKIPLLWILSIIVLIVAASGVIILWQNKLNSEKNITNLQREVANLQLTIQTINQNQQEQIKQDQTPATNEVYIKNSPVKILLPEHIKIGGKIMPAANSFYNTLPHTHLTIVLWQKNDIEVGSPYHPITNTLDNYCQNELIKTTAVDCQESIINNRKAVTIIDARIPDGGGSIISVNKIILLDTGLNDGSILSFQLMLPEYASAEPNAAQTIADKLSKRDELFYTTKIALDDLDFIVNNLSVDQANLAGSQIPNGFIDEYDCQQQGGHISSVGVSNSNCQAMNQTDVNINIADFGQIYSYFNEMHPSVRCCKINNK